MHIALAFLLLIAADQDPGTKFAVAIEDHDVDAVKALLQSGLSTETPIDYGEHQITPLVKAAWDGHVETDTSTLTPLMFAASAGNVDMIRFLVKRGAKVNRGAKEGGQTALLSAIYAGKPDAVQALVELKADVNAKTKDGDTPLKAAMKGDQDDVVKILKAA